MVKPVKGAGHQAGLGCTLTQLDLTLISSKHWKRGQAPMQQTKLRTKILFFYYYFCTRQQELL